MTWFRLDDEGAFGAKILMAGNEAYGAWCRAGQWSSQHETDGRVPLSTALTIGPARLWKKLLEAIPPGHVHGLVEAIDGGYQIHDFLDYNPSAAEVLALREARSTAGRNGGSRSADARRM